MQMHTNIEEEILKGKASVTVISLSEEKYVYKLAKDSTTYILKGYKIPVSPLDDPSAQDVYVEVLRQLGLVYQEFYLAKIDSAFTPHYVKPLHLATAFEPPESSGEDGTIYAELLFEHGGDSLDTYRKKGNLRIKQIYNWMRQSANALSFLHGAGISHLDIKPSNMVYDESKDLLKVIDMGSSTTYTSQSQMFSSTKSVTSKIKELTIYYAPPEILQAYNNKALLASPISDPLEFIVGNIDVYCWAMCFYTLLLKKKDKELENEITKYKLHKIEEYAPFIANMRENIKKLVAKDDEEMMIKGFIEEVLGNALQYNAKDRPKLETLVEDMKKFDQAQGIALEYHRIEKAAQEKMNVMLGLHTFIEEQEAKIRKMLEEAKKKQKEFEDLEKNAIKVKEQLEEFEKEKVNMQNLIEEKKKELEPLTESVKEAREKNAIQAENTELKKELEKTKEKNEELVQELSKQKAINSTLFKKCEAYTELQLKYDTDTMTLSKEKEKLAKKLNDMEKYKERVNKKQQQ